MTRYGLSFWLSRHPRRRVSSWPRHRGALDVEVAIVGGGLTGCATAYACAAAGIRVALFEANRVGGAGAGAGDGVLSLEPSPSWRDLEATLGRRQARLLRDAYRHSALDFAAMLRRLEPGGHLERQRAACLARSAEAEEDLRREFASRKDAGLDATWLAGTRLRKEIGVDSGGALITADALTLDPYRACLGLARAAARRGCAVFEGSRVLGERRSRDGVALRFASGSVTTRVVVVATGAPPPFIKGLARHFRVAATHHVVTPPLPAAVRRAMGGGGAVVRLAGVPARRLRWTPDHRVIFSRGDCAPAPARSRERTLIQRTGQSMYELSLVYPVISGVQADAGWDAQVAGTPDGLPCLGPHRNHPHHLFALGADRAGVASAWLAARLVLRHLAGRPEKADELFGFGRLRASREPSTGFKTWM